MAEAKEGGGRNQCMVACHIVRQAAEAVWTVARLQGREGNGDGRERG